MDSTNSNDIDNSPNSFEILSTQISTVSEDGNQLGFDQQPTGLIALNKDNFDYLVNSRQELSNQLVEANQIIATLREEISAINEKPNNSGVPNMAAHYKLLTDLLLEKQNLAEQLAKHENEAAQHEDEVALHKAEATHFKAEAAKLQKIVDSYETDYNALLADYNYMEKLQLRTRNLFRHKISEVFKMQAELREIRIRPKAPDGCLNCSMPGHSFKFCRNEYTGRFCQKCANPDFSTDECPWPHVAEGKFDIPDHQRCKTCKRPKNLPDVNCGECRKREMERRIAKRDQQMLEVIKQTSSLQITSKPLPAQEKGAIPKLVSLLKLEEPLNESSPRAETTSQTPPQKQKSSRKTISRDDKNACELASSNSRKQPPASPPSENDTGSEPRDICKVLAPFDSDDNNIELWKTLSQAYELGIEKEKE
ncbi:uncharacterized protein LOC122508724 [Leptopilina heterotoma]|uniref:uncharacterized protein LOC122508724 n=1 Tax=Leptopilina heterotoma TaxID=63436 RepID=UPI001CA9BB15|nr:uncharacterized protein LOC122508724 [Leptopilina heterotoma]